MQGLGLKMNENKLKKIEEKKWRELCILVAFLIGLLLVAGGQMFNYGKHVDQIQSQSFNKGWTIEMDGKTYEEQDLNAFRFSGQLKEGDEVVMSHRIPEDLNWNSALRVQTSHSTITASIPGRILYTYGEDVFVKGGMVGSGYHMIQIPESARGKMLTITMISATDNGFSCLYDMRIISGEVANQVFGADHLFMGSLGIFLIEIGFLILAFSFISMIYAKKTIAFTMVGLSSIFMGTWTLCVTKTIQLFSNDLTFNLELEYMSLFLIPLPVIGLIQFTRRLKAFSWRKSVMGIGAGLMAVFNILSWVLHFTNLVHFDHLLPLFHILTILCVVLAAITAYYPSKKNPHIWSHRDQFLAAGIFALLFSGLFEVFRYNIQKFLHTSNHNFSVTMIPLGMIVFLILMGISFVLDRFEETRETAEREMYKKIAYTDTLTGLGSRLEAEEAFRSLDTSTDTYIMVSIDLNDLKKTNDTYGHLMGDHFIIDFAKAVQSEKQEEGILSRMGGDEFLLIYLNESEEKVRERIKRVEEKCREISRDAIYDLTFAYGLAISTEKAERNAEQIYQLADARMYEMKKAMKAEK